MSGLFVRIENHTATPCYIASYSKQLPVVSPSPVKYIFNEIKLLQPGEGMHAFGMLGQVVAWAFPSPTGGDAIADIEFTSTMRRMLRNTTWTASTIVFIVRLVTMNLSDFLPLELIGSLAGLGADASVDEVVSTLVSHFIDKAAEALKDKATGVAILGTTQAAGAIAGAFASRRQAQQFKSKEGAARARQTIHVSYGLISCRVLKVVEDDGELVLVKPGLLTLSERRYFPLTRKLLGMD